jgi:large subunit ribosomal protein L19e
MTDLLNQKRIAADVLGVGKNSVWIDPMAAEEVADSITREDIRSLIAEGVITKRQKRGVSRARARAKRNRHGQGSRKGAKGARMNKKRGWILRIRALRKELRSLRNDGVLDAKTYRKMYIKASSGEFRSVSHLNAYLRSKELILDRSTKG